MKIPNLIQLQFVWSCNKVTAMFKFKNAQNDVSKITYLVVLLRGYSNACERLNSDLS